MHLSKTSIFFLLILILFSSCKDPDEYRIDPEFAGYLKRFTDSAAVRGLHFNPQSDGLIMEFATLKSNVAGLTHFENPIRIEFDKAYWEKISKAAVGADEMKEELVFHELGHGLLRRKHINTLLENGDWKSIMCGGEQTDNRPWNINYRGIRRNYYINELFNQSFPAPTFSSMQLPVDTFGYQTKMSLSFDNLQNTGWSITDDSRHTISLENGRMRFDSKVTDVFLGYVKTNIDVTSDFSYELNMEYQPGDIVGFYGIMFGFIPSYSTGQNDPIEYFTINRDSRMRMGNRQWFSFFTELSENSILTIGKNKLKVFKSGQMMYYFINNIYVYCSEIEIKESGSLFGFVVPSKGTVWLDNFLIKQSSYSAGLKKHQASGTKVEFGLTTVRENSTDHLIYK